MDGRAAPELCRATACAVHIGGEWSDAVTLVSPTYKAIRNLLCHRRLSIILTDTKDKPFPLCAAGHCTPYRSGV